MKEKLAIAKASVKRKFITFSDYQVSNFGTVWSIKRNCILEPKSLYKGNRYLTVRLTKEGKRYNIKHHRLVWESFRGFALRGFVVHHEDGNPSNNCLDNLSLKRGGRHSSDHLKGVKRNPFSEEHREKIRQFRLGYGKITWEIVDEIRIRFLIKKESAQVLAKEFGLHINYVRYISRGWNGKKPVWNEHLLSPEEILDFYMCAVHQ